MHCWGWNVGFVDHEAILQKSQAKETNKVSVYIRKSLQEEKDTKKTKNMH